MAERVDILLGVYNGAAYLGEQVASLVGQSHRDWTLLIRDDGSTDGTRELLPAIQRMAPDRIRVVPGGAGNLGALRNFSALLELATAPYIMLCDQDDVWFPGKVASTLEAMKALEARRGAATPLLVHTDLKVADAGLRVIAESLWRYQKIDPDGGESLNRVLVQNCVTGCSAMINRPLRDLALPVPPEALMHDWWLALVAAAFGGIAHRGEPTMLYRQHGANDLGARQWSAAALLRQVATPAGARAFLAERRAVLDRVRDQAAAFLARYGGRLTPRQREMVATYVAMDGYPLLRRKWSLVRHRFFHTGFARNIVRFLLW